ncbi:MAG: hypothetical protein LIP08_15740 [Bacteroides sp.]|nr:hypothetical protein [Bacteroides sp.]
MKSMYIGSGDVQALMSGKHTKSHHELLKRFVSGMQPYYNAKASPIDPLRIGAILEDRYLMLLPDNYFAQYVCQCEEMNVFRCSLDFAKIEHGKVVDFEELKTVYLSDFLEFEPLKHYPEELLEFIRKNYSPYYYQVQQQLYCTGLKECTLVFLSVLSYIDEENLTRNIQPNEYLKIRIERDEVAIAQIRDRGEIFQQIKDCYDIQSR